MVTGMGDPSSVSLFIAMTKHGDQVSLLAEAEMDALAPVYTGPSGEEWGN